VSVRIFKSKTFAREAKKHGLVDSDLAEAAATVKNGRVDVDLGGGLVKQRVARRGGGKSGGFRAIMVVRPRDRVFFVHIFAKKDRQNIDDSDLKRLQLIAGVLSTLDDSGLARSLDNGSLIEVSGKVIE
jgi:hypothetical protein